MTSNTRSADSAEWMTDEQIDEIATRYATMTVAGWLFRNEQTLRDFVGEILLTGSAQPSEPLQAMVDDAQAMGLYDLDARQAWKDEALRLAAAVHDAQQEMDSLTRAERQGPNVWMAADQARRRFAAAKVLFSKHLDLAETQRSRHTAGSDEKGNPGAAPQLDEALLREWIVGRWHAEVANRPMVNIHRRSLDDAWRQMLRHLGADDRALLGPTHDELAALSPTEQAPPEPVA